ncbi:hypothetical protein MZO42_15705 [Sphingomonas psychrotolerans]|uniref:Uncharacterized protein n=1 Tax=Sphingomonas psychrotolerans TaxID=1327635 RepID=A0ABU3N771_9SPHN|nr:hypothetical protein [Sphingomonas psychrotolerans]MDT8760146.1 hypothetical protein [Sphingomonas psychrotolerans]
MRKPIYDSLRTLSLEPVRQAPARWLLGLDAASRVLFPHAPRSRRRASGQVEGASPAGWSNDHGGDGVR